MNNSVFTNIVVATDDSGSARKAVDYAIKIAKVNNAKLYAVYVIALGEVAVTQHDPRDPGWKKQMKENIEAQGREATAYAIKAGTTADVTVEPAVLEGNPADEIVNFADKNDVDLVIIGSFGKTGIKRFLLGSVAENVVRHAKKPVLVIK